MKNFLLVYTYRFNELYLTKISTAVTEPTKYMNTITADELKLTCIL
jgi:hypothetical protein